MAKSDMIPRPQAAPQKVEMRGVVWPVYLVADESGSMVNNIGEVNDGLTALLDAFAMDPMLASKVWISVIGFDYELRPHLGLSDLRYVPQMPVLSTREGSTVYSLVFRDLRSRIDADVTDLRARHYGVIRPPVFFLSDGVPDEDDPWRPALADLTSASFSRRPNILTFGLGDAEPRVLVEVASDQNYAFVYEARGSDTRLAIEKFFEALTRSVETSAHAMGSGKSELQVVQPEGFTLAVKYIT